MSGSVSDDLLLPGNPSPRHHSFESRFSQLAARTSELDAYAVRRGSHSFVVVPGTPRKIFRRAGAARRLPRAGGWPPGNDDI